MTFKGNYYSWDITNTLPSSCLAVSISNAQTAASTSSQEQVATVVNSSASKAPANAPVYTDYRGVSIGMTADEVRSKLNGLKKGNGQDFLVLSENESAQIYYDDKSKVTAISIDYIGDKARRQRPRQCLE